MNIWKQLSHIIDALKRAYFKRIILNMPYKKIYNLDRIKQKGFM